MLRWLPLCLLAAMVAASAASAEGVWLRGSGERVWVDRGDGEPPQTPVERKAPQVEKSAGERAGFTRVATSPVPSINRAYSQQAEGDREDARVHHHHHHCGHYHGHSYTPYVYVPGYPSPAYYPRSRSYYPGSYREYRPRYRYSDGTYYRPRRSSYGADARYGSSYGGGYEVRGGAYRRTR